MRDELTYYCTNENLEAIVLALKPNSNDKILAVGGSGDQAFVLLENAKEVYCVDKNKAQVKYMEKRRNALRRGDYKSFLQEIEASIWWGDAQLQMREDYFKQKNRIHNIKEKLNRLTVKHGDIVEIAKTEPGLTKVYLSNAIVYDQSENINKEMFATIMKGIAARLPHDGLIYVSNHEYLCDVIYMCQPPHTITTERGAVRITDPKDIFPEYLRVDPELTTLARRYEDEGFWSPAVYRKI